MTTLDVIKYILLIPYFLWFIVYAIVSVVLVFPYMLLQSATTYATLLEVYWEFIDNFLFPSHVFDNTPVDYPEVTENKQPTKTDE